MKTHKRNYLEESYEDSRYSRLVWKEKKTSYRYTLNPIFSKKLHYCLDNGARI